MINLNLLECILQVDFTSSKCTRQSELGIDTIDTMCRVDVLDTDNLVTGCASLAGGNGGRGEEVLPDLGRNS